jgi:hypothetical protein
LEGCGHGLVKIPSQNFVGGTEEYHENLSQDRRCPEIREEHLPNTIAECCFKTSLFGVEMQEMYI